MLERSITHRSPLFHNTRDLCEISPLQTMCAYSYYSTKEIGAMHELRFLHQARSWRHQNEQFNTSGINKQKSDMYLLVENIYFDGNPKGLVFSYIKIIDLVSDSYTLKINEITHIAYLTTTSSTRSSCKNSEIFTMSQFAKQINLRYVFS